VTFWQNNISAKATRNMLMKLTAGGTDASGTGTRIMTGMDTEDV